MTLTKPVKLKDASWSSPDEARSWLQRERDRLGWTNSDIVERFSFTAVRSDLYIGRGGGALFARPTENRIRKFELNGETVPEWLRWLPLVIEHHDARSRLIGFSMFEWERANIPEHHSLREDEQGFIGWG